MDFEKYLETGAHQIEQELEEILAELLADVKKNKPKLLPLALGFINSCRGGKRIRGVLVKLGYELAQGDPANQVEILRLGAAVEILHSAFLIHDDIIDESLTRRGKPSLYQALGGNHYGISQAISLGDYGFFLAFKIISQTNFPDKIKNNALELFSKVMMDTAWGEMLDLEKIDPLAVMKLKTAGYTVTGPLQLGAILAGKEELSGVLGEFGESLGIAFQIRDDILDKEAGSIEEAEREAVKYKNRAMGIVPQITKDPKMSKLLEQMAKYLVNRTK